MIQIDTPVHGAVVHERLGCKGADGGLAITVSGTAPFGNRVTVNGVEARRAGSRFTAVVTLRDHETPVVARTDGPAGRAEHAIRVVYDRHSVPRYRFSIDDNIFFLRDLARNRPRSLFDCFYLDILRRLHDTYGVKFSINLFYSTPEQDFCLADMPDTWRAEWRDNADWMILTFHARNEFPDRLYEYADAETLGRDYDQVATEIVRFAGEETWAPPTVVHWGMVHPAAMPALVERGVKVLSGFFGLNSGSKHQTDDEEEAGTWNTRYDINYCLDDARSEYVSQHDALRDFANGIVYSAGDIVCNNTPVDKVAATLEPATRDPARSEILDLFTHEQYFWPFYHNHRPDHADRCEAAIRFCADRGYAPVFFHEGFLGVPV